MTTPKLSLRERIKRWLRTDGISDADLDTMTDDLVDVIGDDDGDAPDSDPDDGAATADPPDDDGARMGDKPDDDDPDDDDDDKRSKSGEQRAMTRAEWRRLAREEAKREMAQQRSGRYGDTNIVPNPVMTLARDGEEGLSIGNLIRVQHQRNTWGRAASRELEWMERSDYLPADASAIATVPFEFLSRYVPMRNERNAERQRALRATPPEQTRAAITTGATVGGGAVGVSLDVSNSLAWLYDRAPILEYLNVIPGVTGEWQTFYGSNTAANKPGPDPVEEGGAVAESSPQLVRLRRLPVTIADRFPISSAMLAAATVNIEGIALMGAENLVREHLVREVLSGPGVGAAFADVTNAITTGITHSGISGTNYGAADANFDRDDIVGIEQSLRAQNPVGDMLIWIVSTGLEALARTKRIGGTESVRFVAERDSGSLFMGIMNPNPGGMGIPYVSSTHFGENGVTNPGILMYGSASCVPIWGGGIDVIMFNDPNNAADMYGFRLHANHAFVNPHNGYRIRQT